MICLRLFLLLLLASASIYAQSVLTWTGTGGPCGFSTMQLIRSNDGLLAAGARVFYHSSDAGESWTARSSINIPGFLVYGHALSPSGAILVGGHGNQAGGVLFRSSDEGRTWENLFLPGRSGAAVAVASDGTILAGGPSDPIHRSTDNGATWTRTPLSGVLGGALTILPDGSILAGGTVGTQEGIHRSTDNGVSWTVVHPIPSTRAVASIVPAGGGSAAGIITSAGADAVVRSTDNGETWTVETMPADMQKLLTLLAVPSEGTLYAGTGLGQVLRWNTATGLWERVSSGMAGSYVYSLAFIPGTATGDRLVAGTDIGPFRLGYGPDEEEIWVPTCNGVLENSTVGITVTAAGNILVATRSAAVYRSSGNSGVWWLGVKERYAVNAMAEQEDGSLVIGTILGGLRRYVRGDDSSQRIDHGFAGSSRTITAVAVAGGNEIIAGTAEGSLYRSLDNGLAWDSISAPVGVTVGGARAIVPYGDVVYIAATNGLFKRLPGDSMLTQIPVGGGPQSFTTLSIAPGGYMAVAGDEWAWLSSDGGSAWKKLPHLADGRSFMSIVVDGEGKVYAVSKDRLNINFGGWVYFTSATESRWRDADRPTDSLGAFAIALAPDGTLYATSQTEVFRSTVPSAIPSGRQADAAAIALTVTPTPATSSTTIRFTLPRAGEATLTMSDAGGREVMRQRLGRRSAGEQTVVIDISSLTPGLYPCEIRSGEDRAAAIVHVVK